MPAHSRHTRGRAAVAATASLLLSGCLPTLTSFSVPPEVAPGKIVEVHVEGRSSPGTLGRAACVVQVPSSFVLLDAAGWGDIDTIMADPSVLAGLTPEQGHYLVAYSAGPGGNPPADYTGGIRIYFRAPAAVGGPFLFKAVLAGQSSQGWTVTDPPGFAGFIALNAPHAQTVHVVESPSSGLAVEAALVRPGSGPYQLFDFDGDGHHEVIEHDHIMSTTRVWSQRYGTWAPLPFTNPPGMHHSLRFVDLNRDGHADIVDATGRVLFGDGGASWTVGPAASFVSPSPLNFSVGDINRDGWPDLVFLTLPPGGYRVQVFLNNLGTSWVAANNGLSQQIVGQSVPTTCDVNGDANPDLVHFPYCWLGDGAGNWTPTVAIAPTSSWNGNVYGTDMDGDGDAELLHMNYSGVSVWNWQPQSWQQRWIAPHAGRVMMLPTDWDGDGAVDIVLGPPAAAASTPPAPIEVWRNAGQLNFQQSSASHLIVLRPHYTGGLSVDFDSNGVDDLVMFEWFPAAGVHSSALLQVQPTRTGVSPFGAACAGPSLPAPTLLAIGTPRRGNARFGLRLGGGLPSGPAALWLGASKRTAFGQPLLPFDLTPLGAPGCTLLADPASATGIVCSATGVADLPLPVPNLPALLRQTFFVQGVIAQPGANAVGLLFSQGLAIRVE